MHQLSNGKTSYGFYKNYTYKIWILNKTRRTIDHLISDDAICPYMVHQGMVNSAGQVST